jgi:hypothetical protein
MEPSSDRDNWAPNIDRLKADGGVNVGGRKLTGPQQGFGPLWQKTYSVTIPGVAPEKVISEWKANYGSFWPKISRFNAPLAGIKPGEVGNIKSMQLLSTGVMVLYTDETSFCFMTPEGHPFAGWITFSSFQDEGAEAIAQVKVLIRPSDPLWDIAFLVGVAKGEDWMWQHTLRALAGHFGGGGDVSTEVVKVDRKRLWNNAGNIRKNAMVGSIGHLLQAPFRRNTGDS